MSNKVGVQEVHKDFQGVPKQIEVLNSQVSNLLKELQLIHSLLPKLDPDVDNIIESLSEGVQNLITQYERDNKELRETLQMFMSTILERVNELEEIVLSNRMSIQVTPVDPVNPKPGRIWMLGTPNK